MPSARRAKLTSSANVTKAGGPSQPYTMTAVCPAGRWSALPYNGCWKISATVAWISSSSIKSTGLTRSLADFAKLVDVFNAYQVSFVSVTQQFNTATSMGRLTLNMLLSFAQFEREVTGERIRDKIAASKKKGMWMGGYPPLGYDVLDRKLVINEREAAQVRKIFELYLDEGSVRLVRDRLAEEGITSKVRQSTLGVTTGGRPLLRGNIYEMLRNRLYRGEIAHKGHVYAGEHQPIIDANALGERPIPAEREWHRTRHALQSTASQPAFWPRL